MSATCGVFVLAGGSAGVNLESLSNITFTYWFFCVVLGRDSRISLQRSQAICVMEMTEIFAFVCIDVCSSRMLYIVCP